MELAPNDLSWRVTLGVTLAEALFKRSQIDAAATKFNHALELALRREQDDYYVARDAGWAAYRLALLKPAKMTPLLSQAEKSLVVALRLVRPDASDAVSVKFNLALVMLCSNRFALALREFDSVSKLATASEPRLYRGLIGRAKAGLLEAIELLPLLGQSPHVHKVLTDLEKRHSGPPRPQA
jgi:hypothetical protein